MKALPPPDPALFGDLARRLHEDAQGKVLAEYRDCFEAARLTAKRKLHEPLPPEEFATHLALAEGAELGAEVVTAVWDSLHR